MPGYGSLDRYFDEFAAMMEPDIFMTDVYPRDTKAWEPGAGGNTWITHVAIEESGEGYDALLGLFRDDRGDRYFMITNLRHNANASAGERTLAITMEFAPGVRTLFRLDRRDGTAVPVNLGGGILHTTLPGGTGDLYKYTPGPFPGT